MKNNNLSFTSYLTYSPVRKIISTITLISFLITILWTSGFSSLYEKVLEEKYKNQRSVYHKWSTVAEQLQTKKLTEIYDKNTNQIYRFDKEGKLVEVEDKNKNLLYRYTTDEKGEKKVEVINLLDKSFSEDKSKAVQQQLQEQKPVQQEEVQRQLTTRTQQKLATSVKLAEEWVEKFTNSDKETQDNMLTSLGLTRQEVENLSKEQLKQKVAEIISLRMDKDLPESDVTVKKLTQNLQELLSNVRNAITQFFINLVSKLRKENQTVDEPEVTIEQLQELAKQQGVNLNSGQINYEQLKQVLKESPAIVYLKDSTTGKGMFLIVTDIKDDRIVGIGVDGEERVVMNEKEFLQQWDGKTLSIVSLGEELDDKTKKETKGTFFNVLISKIKSIFVADLQQYKLKQQQLGSVVSARQLQTVQQAISYIEGKLYEYLNADPQKKAQIAAELGLSVEQLANLTAEQVQNIIAYLKSQGDKIINCAVEALKNVLDSAGVIVSSALIAAKAILVDILTGNFQTTSTSNYDASQVQISMFALQKVAASFGVSLSGYKTDIEGLKEALASGRPVIVWMDLGGGMGHYVTVTSIDGDKITYKDADGNTYTMLVEEFKQKTKGSIKVLSEVEVVSGEKLVEQKLR
ncbi:MAG: cysteine peptidase family C39 domain-containing protein, partial [Elusimicrobiota bacterium]|nr:cysteine peptidase family C39 domain-containing protein [Elusimicrobiota bacterium]